MHLDRRALLAASLTSLATASLAKTVASADDERPSRNAPGADPSDNNLYPLKDDQGKPVVNYRLTSTLTTDGLPGVLWTPSESPDVILVEFFDYNCPFCRKAARDLDGMRAKDKDFRIGFVQNAILGLDSFQAARVSLAVLKTEGPQAAYALHNDLLAQRGVVSGISALKAVGRLGFDVAKIEAVADEADMGAILKRHISLAENLGFSATPSFMLNGVGVLGYPGPKAMKKMIAAVRSCDELVCSD
ncbi:DsbA family protein [Roseiarcaceae bacterium H3SJ34-1]|uniref:DsbA family protein n=1 Tax=Terripilifer ovatus TaxID=3032367 RepID=UPI003AB91D0C|nr:DsbA family protein [Roseiarcaceae bacterium H3SJ34-1]